MVTWSGAVVGEIWNQERLGVDDVDPIGADVVETRQGAQPLRTRIAESGRNFHFRQGFLQSHANQS